MTEDSYPMRINKYLAHQKHSTRRGADVLIEKGQVFINGRRAVLGDKVVENDKVEVRFRGKPKPYIYLAYNKPEGIITHSPQGNERDIQTAIERTDVAPIGRLDKESSGLIILTDDGRVTEPLLSPESKHDKEYLVTTKEKLRTSFKAKMEAGVQIDEEKTRPCKVQILDEKTFRVTLTEGKKHQIRRMCVALFQEVDTLKRVRIMNIELGTLKEGQWREIKGAELETFLSALGL